MVVSYFVSELINCNLPWILAEMGDTKVMNVEKKNEPIKMHLKRIVSKYFEYVEVIRRCSFDDLVKYMYRPKDPSSLGIIRFLFGKFN